MSAPSDPERRADPSGPPHVPLRRRLPRVLAVVGTALVALVVWLLYDGLRQIRELTDVTLSATTIREAAWASLQRETGRRFLVTGRLEVTAITEVEDTRTVFPGILDLSLGTSRATVRVPGRIHYGVDMAAVGPGDLAVAADSALVVRLPALSIEAVEPLLGGMEVRTERGWARLPGRSERDAERRALELVRPVLRRQGIAHLADARQPRVNTARAVGALLLPTLAALGVSDPEVRVRLDGEVYTVRPDGLEEADGSDEADGTDAPDARTGGGAS